MSSANSAASASVWAILGGAGTRGISFLVFLLIARELNPSDMGVMAIALSLGMLIDTVSELGLGDQVVRFQGPDAPKFVSSVFWLQLGVAVLGALVLVVLSPWLAIWYKEADLRMACAGVAMACVANGASWVPMSLLNKRLEFKAIALRNAMATTLGGCLGLGLAYLGWGVKALVAMHVANALTGCAVASLSSGWRPSRSCQLHLVRPVRDVALHALGTRVVETITSRFDQLLIGSFFGAAVLGLYALAVRFFDVIFQTLCGPVAVVLFSYLAQTHHDLVELRKRYLGILRNLALLAPAVFLLAAMILPDMLLLIFGQKWAGVAPYLRIILGAGAVLAVTFSHTPVFSAIGQPRINFLVSSVASVVWLVSLLFLPKLGALYAAVLWVIRAALGIPIQLYFLRSVVHLKMTDYGRAVGPAIVLLALLLMMYGVFAPSTVMDTWWRVVRLCSLSLAGGLVVLVFGYRYSQDIRNKMLMLFQARRAS